MRGSVWQFCYVSAHFRHILTMFVLIRNTFYRAQSKKSPLDAEYTSGGGFFSVKTEHLLSPDIQLCLTLDAQRLMLGSLCISLGIFKIPNALLCNIVFIKR